MVIYQFIIISKDLTTNHSRTTINWEEYISVCNMGSAWTDVLTK